MTLPMTVPTAAPPAQRTRTPGATVGVAVLLGLFVGGCLGSATFLGFYLLSALTNGGVTVNDLGVVIVYGAFAFGIGAVVGMVQGLVSVAAVLALRARSNLAAARVVGALGALVLPLLTVPRGWIPAVLLPFAAVSAGAAACLMEVVTRRRDRVGP